jgi:hypothetical protein
VLTHRVRAGSGGRRPRTVAPETVTIRDDLDRTRIFPTDGSKRRYQLGASPFNARVEWRGSQLRKDIDGDFGFNVWGGRPASRRLAWASFAVTGVAVVVVLVRMRH